MPYDLRTFCLRHAAHALTFREMLGIFCRLPLPEPLVAPVLWMTVAFESGLWTLGGLLAVDPA